MLKDDIAALVPEVLASPFLVIDGLSVVHDIGVKHLLNCSREVLADLALDVHVLRNSEEDLHELVAAERSVWD